jgi:hypothetical protein
LLGRVLRCRDADVLNRVRDRVCDLGAILLRSSFRRQLGPRHGLSHPILDAIFARTGWSQGPAAAERSERLGLHGGPGEQAADPEGGHGPDENLSIAGCSHRFDSSIPARRRARPPAVGLGEIRRGRDGRNPLGALIPSAGIPSFGSDSDQHNLNGYHRARPLAAIPVGGFMYD